MAQLKSNGQSIIYKFDGLSHGCILLINMSKYLYFLDEHFAHNISSLKSEKNYLSKHFKIPFCP